MHINKPEGHALEKKKLIELLAAIFIAVIFVSSYAAFGAGQGSAPSQGATTTVQGTEISGVAVASVVSYGRILDVNVTCGNASAVTANAEALMNSLMGNGSVESSNPVADNEISVLLGNYTATEAYNALATDLGSNAACTRVVATEATVQLPSAVSVIYGGGSIKIAIPADLRNYTEPIRLSNATGGKVGVAVAMLVSNSGTIADAPNQVSIALRGT